MAYEDDHFVAILALQLPPPAQRALAGELFVTPDQPGRLGRRRVELHHAAREMRARRGCELWPAVEAWLATASFNNPNAAPGSL